ncbi:MAG: gliding motility-associated C-terminal domain-containing protein, partial [Bacteroidales bacterium]|nr:gliding motility-associated C-terminal domain-containing protein [Bacteroidales bacterium]
GGASSITLFNAQAGVSYQVKDNNLDIGLPQVGNADTLIFYLPDIFTDKAFTILATDTATGCSRVLDSVFRVNVVPLVADIEASLSSAYAPAMASLSSVSQAADSWTWLLNGEVVSATEQTQLELTEPGEYEIVLQVLSSPPWQCSDADTTILTLLEQIDIQFEFPSAFSPNGDGYNDVFVPFTEGVDAYSVTVKDQWGRTMAAFDRNSTGWNGKTTGGAEAPAGAYYYQSDAVDYNGLSLERSGVVYLIRDLIDLTPNPVVDKLVVSMNGRLAGRKHLRILQVSGKELFVTDFDGDSLTIDTSWLDKAMYIMQISNETDMVNVKFIKD